MLIGFQIDGSISALIKKLGLDVPDVAVGVHRGVLYKAKNKATEPLVSNYQNKNISVEVNSTSGKVRARSWGTDSVFAKILATTSLRQYIEKELSMLAPDVIVSWIQSEGSKSDVAKLHLRNGLAAIVKRAYVMMARNQKASAQCQKAKKHPLYRIDTGTAYNSITSVIMKKEGKKK